LETFGFEFFRFGETRLGGKDLRWFAKKRLKKIRFLVFFFVFLFMLQMLLIFPFFELL